MGLVSRYIISKVDIGQCYIFIKVMDKILHTQYFEKVNNHNIELR